MGMEVGKTLACHVPKKDAHICLDHMAKTKINSSTVFECMV